MLRKVFLALTLIVGLAAVVTVTSQPVLAQSSVRDDVRKQLGAANQKAGFGEPTDPRVLVANIIRTVFGLVGLVFMIITLYGGFLWMTAAGSEDRVDRAKKLLRSAVIGLFIALSAYSITWFATRIALAEFDDYNTSGFWIERSTKIKCDDPYSC